MREEGPKDKGEEIDIRRWGGDFNYDNVMPSEREVVSVGRTFLEKKLKLFDVF